MGAQKIRAVVESYDVEKVIDVYVNEDVSSEFDTIVEKYREFIVNRVDKDDDLLELKLEHLDNEAKALWDTLDKSSSREYLWEEASDFSNSRNITSSLKKIKNYCFMCFNEGIDFL